MTAYSTCQCGFIQIGGKRLFWKRKPGFFPGNSYGREDIWPDFFDAPVGDLPSGDYYTMFTKSFDFTDSPSHAETDKSYNTDNITFRINLRIR